jgi:hypothetical protein
MSAWFHCSWRGGDAFASSTGELRCGLAGGQQKSKYRSEVGVSEECHLISVSVEAYRAKS